MNPLSRTYITEKWKHIGFQKYFKNTSWMFLGQASMVISLFINIWMARHLGPENFGTISYVFAFVGIFSFIANFGLNDILIRDLVQYPEKKDKLLGTAFRAMSVAGVLAFLVANISVFIFEDSVLIRILVLVYSTIFLWSPVNVISAYFQATIQAKRNALAQIMGTFITSIFKIYLLATGQGVIWIILAFALDYVIGSLIYIYNYSKSDLNFKTWSYDPQTMKTFLKSSSFIMLSTAAGYLLFKIDQIMIKAYLGEEAVGLYAAAVKLSEIWYFIPAIICSSLFPAIINAKKSGDYMYRSRLKKLYAFLALIAVAIAIPISLLSNLLISTLYGLEYLASVQILQIYVWSGIGLFVMTGINKYFMVENHLKSIFHYNLLAVIINVILNMILIPQIGLYGAAWATLVSYSISPLIIFLNKNMRNKKFVSIIWGYSKHMYGFAPEENYHLHAIKVAKELGFKTYAIVKGSKSNMENDPNFDKDIIVIDYANFIQFMFHVIKFSLQGALFYVNSYEWQSFVVPFFARRTIFMAHTQPKRQTFAKQRIQNFVYRFFSKIRLNNETEKDFLIKEGISADKLSVVPLVVSQDVFKNINSQDSRSDLVYFGNVTAKKDLPTIISAFEIIKATRPEIRLHIIGNIWDKNTEARIESSPHKNDIMLHGFLPNETLVSELNKRLIYLNSSFDEGQCVAVYDAALSGCALCLPNIMSFIGVFKDKALFHDVSDHGQMAKNILHYLDNPDLIARHTEKCEKMIRDEYSQEKVEMLFKNLIQNT